MIFGNFIYFLCAFTSYNNFKLILMNKFGAKVIFHRIFSLIQFHYSILKCDVGLIIFLLITTFIFDNKNTILIILDCLFFVISFCFVLTMRNYVFILIILDKKRK